MKLVTTAVAAAALMTLSACGEREAEPIAAEGEGIVEGEGIAEREGESIVAGEGEGLAGEAAAEVEEGAVAAEGEIAEVE